MSPAAYGDLERAARTFATEAEHSAELGSPMYAELLRRCADDLRASGPVADVIAGHETDPGEAVLPLRFLGAVHRLVLRREAPALAVHYPSVGGCFDAADADGLWAAFHEVITERADDIRPLLDQAPQTNEVGRAAGLMGGLLAVVAAYDRPVRLAEIGASGGLNLRADHFAYRHADGWTWGPPDGPVVIDDAWRGPVPGGDPDRHVDVVERLGCDSAPIDPTTTKGRLTLTSYVWPDMTARIERLRGALAVAARVPATVVQASAGDFLDDLEPVAGVTTVLWHSIMWQYLDAAEQDRAHRRIDALGAQASDKTPFAQVTLEPRDVADEGLDVGVTLRLWPGGQERVLGSAAPHGPPVQWRAGA